MALITRESIDAFYRHKRIAVLGASRDKRKFGRLLLEALVQRGFDAVAVNPNVDLLGEYPCYRKITDVPQPLEAAIAVVPPAQQEQVVRECAAACIKQLWIHEHVMKGISNPRAIDLCEELGIEVISGVCPFMFMPQAGFPHNLHAWVSQLCGAQPK